MRCRNTKVEYEFGESIMKNNGKVSLQCTEADKKANIVLWMIKRRE